ncbi:hypothetical protein RFI_05752, partial [Reticulomyxa filosa]
FVFDLCCVCANVHVYTLRRINANDYVCSYKSEMGWYTFYAGFGVAEGSQSQSQSSILRVGCVPVALNAHERDSSSDDENYIDRPLPCYHSTVSSLASRSSGSLSSNNNNNNGNDNYNNNLYCKRKSSPTLLPLNENSIDSRRNSSARMNSALRAMTRSMSIDLLAPLQSSHKFRPTHDHGDRHNSSSSDNTTNSTTTTIPQASLREINMHDDSCICSTVPILDEVLADDLLCYQFELFLRTVFCEENLLFIKGSFFQNKIKQNKMRERTQHISYTLLFFTSYSYLPKGVTHKQLIINNNNNNNNNKHK